MEKIINLCKSEDYTLMEKIGLLYSFLFLLPMSFMGIIYIVFMLATGQVDTNNISFGIYG